MGSVMDLVRRLSPKGWAMVGGAFAAVVVFIVLVMHFASAPSYSTLETGIDPSQTSKITSTLSTQGIPYQLQNGGTAVAVESGKTAQARVALASAGLLSGTSSNRSPTSVRSRGSSRRRSRRSTVSPPRRSTWSSPTARTSSSLIRASPRLPRCCCQAPPTFRPARSAGSPSWSPPASRVWRSTR